MIELRLMRSFVAVAEELHFGRAAVRLGISQPPLSKHIQQLEETLGASLLQRNNRSVTLTAAGRVFLDEARRTVEQFERAISLAQHADRGESGHLALGFIDAAIYSIVPDAVRLFAQAYPNVKLSLTEMLIPEQIDALAEHRIDAGLIHPPIDRPGIAIETILIEPLIVALPSGHPLARHKEIALPLIAKEPLIQFPRFINPSLYDEILVLCRGAGFSPRIALEPTPKQTIIGLVAAGLGLSLLPACLGNLMRRGVTYRPLTGGNLNIVTSLAWREGENTPAVERFREVVRKASRNCRWSGTKNLAFSKEL
jgi:DNA-binding transcriptional LysR family regulator